MKKFSLIAFAVCLSLQGCMQHESIAHEHRPHDWGTLVSQTHNFIKLAMMFSGVNSPMQQ